MWLNGQWSQQHGQNQCFLGYVAKIDPNLSGKHALKETLQMKTALGERREPVEWPVWASQKVTDKICLILRSTVFSSAH